MKLRTRLIVVFFLLSVVPLAAVTYLSYSSSAAALRDAAEHETDLLAGELGQRMQLVTAQLSDRAQYMMNMTQLQADAEAAVASESEQASQLAQADAMDKQVAAALGDVAALFNSVELTNRRGRGRAGRPRPPIDPDNPQAGRAGRDPSQRQGGRGIPPGQRGLGEVPLAPETPADRMRVDLNAIRRDLFAELIPDGELSTLTRDERNAVGREVNIRMAGITQGIQLGAAELQKQAEEAQQRASAGAVVPALATRTTAEITGNQLAVTLERDGEVLREMTAEINMPTTLATVFSTTHRDAGEVPFAVDQAGQIYTPSDADRVVIEALGPVATPDGPATARVDDWVVVTTSNPAGTGLRLGIARPVGDSLAELRRAAVVNVGVGLGFIAIALVGIVPLAAGLTRNLTRLNDGVRRIAQGDYTVRVPVKSKDEAGQLAAAFNQMAGDVERHQESLVEQERLKRELELGRKIQYDMLPQGPLLLGLTEILGVSVPAKEVGGDFFNYFELPSGHIALLVGDVAGKGVGAALLMANIQASLRTRLGLGQDLSAVAEAIDHDVEVDSPGPVYATLFVGILDPRTRELRYVNAGHHPQFILRKAGGLDRMPSTGLPVGMLAGHGYVEDRVQLAQGDVLFFYTDGTVEAENEAGEMFDPERLEALLAPGADSAADVLATVESAIKAFRGTAEASDDSTTMAVKVG